MSAVELDAVSKRYGGVVAVDDLTLDVPAGEFFALLGPSGCGKTSTLRMIAGFEVPTSGRVRLDGEDVTGLRPHRRPVNTVFQSYALFPHLTVFENVAFGLRRRRVPARDIATQVGDMLELVQLPGVGPRRPHELSGGQQQRVALARALINRPKVLLLDEPLGALDLSLRRAMQLELKRIQRDVGITFVHVTHDQEEAMTLADRIAVMQAGRIEQQGTPEGLYSRPRTEFVAGFLGRSNLLDGPLCGLPAGTRVGIRPERVRLVPAPAAPAATGELGLDVTVVDRGFMGTSTQFVVVTAWGQELVAVTQDPVDLRTGDAGELRWERSHMFELDGVGTDVGAVLVPVSDAVAVAADPVAALARRRRWALAGLLVPGLVWLAVFFVAPMAVLAQTSLQSGSLEAGFTLTWRFATYSEAFARYWPQLLRSFGYAAAATVAALVLAYPLAYFIAFRAGRWRGRLLFLVVLPFLANFLIRTLAWKIILADEGAVVAALQAVGLLAPQGRLLATGWAVVAGLTYNLLPFMVLPLYVSLQRLDARLLEAASDLYAGPLAAFRTVTWPLSRPGVVAGTLLTFIPAAGDYVNARFLGTPAQSMIGNVIESRFLVVLDYPTAAALSFVLLVVILGLTIAYLRRLPVDEVV